MQNFNKLRGFNKTPGELGEAIYNATHKPKTQPIKINNEKNSPKPGLDKNKYIMQMKQNRINRFK